jgi:hypothetical protein
MGIVLLRLSNLPWFIWTGAALLPLGTIGYVLKFDRKDCRSLAVWRMAAAFFCVHPRVRFHRKHRGVSIGILSAR